MEFVSFHVFVACTIVLTRYTVWNNHVHISQSSALAHIDALSKLVPVVPPSTQSTSTTADDLDTPDELAVRSLLLGVLYRTLGDYAMSRSHLSEAYALRGGIKVSTWVGGMSLFEMATLDLVEMDGGNSGMREMKNPSAENGIPPETLTQPKSALRSDQISKHYADWERVLSEADRKLDEALVLSPDTVDLASRLDGRVVMLKEEIRKKRLIVCTSK